LVAPLGEGPGGQTEGTTGRGVPALPARGRGSGERNAWHEENYCHIYPVPPAAPALHLPTRGCVRMSELRRAEEAAAKGSNSMHSMRGARFEALDEEDDIIGDDNNDNGQFHGNGHGAAVEESHRLNALVFGTVAAIALLGLCLGSLLAAAVPNETDTPSSVRSSATAAAAALVEPSSPPPRMPPTQPPPRPPQHPPPPLPFHPSPSPSPSPHTPPPPSPSPPLAPPPPPWAHAITISVVMPPSFDASRRKCEMVGGRLAQIRSAGDTERARAVLQASTYTTAWIGLSDQGHEGQWRWLDGDGEDALTGNGYTLWAAGQPDNGFGAGEGCAEIRTSGEWNDAPCRDRRAYLCEVPEPPDDLSFPCSPGLTPDDPNRRCRYALPQPDSVKKPMDSWAAECVRQYAGSRLAEPRTLEQINLLQKGLRSGFHDSLWLGLKRSGGEWRWSGSNEVLAIDTTRWAPNQPDNDGVCVEMWPDGTWNDRDCTVAKVAACEVVME
jgi:hypothetical protein